MKKVSFFTVMVLVCFFAITAKATTYNVGVARLDTAKTKALVWYPTEDIEGQLFDYYGAYKEEAHTRALWQAGIAQGDERFPIIVFAHGLGMCAYQSAFLVEHWVSQGYVVIAPDFDDAAYCRIDEGVNFTVKHMAKALILGGNNFDKTVELAYGEQLPYLRDPAYRPRQVSASIDAVLSSLEFDGIVERTEIAVVGHSFGSWTALAIAGAEIDCRAPESYSDEICEAPRPELDTSSFQESICCYDGYKGEISHFKDARVRVVILLNSGVAVSFPRYDLEEVDIPVMILFGDHFEGGKEVNYQILYDSLDEPKYGAVFTGVGHMTAGQITAQMPGAKLVMRDFWFYERKKAALNKYTTAFLNEHLKYDVREMRTIQAEGCLFVDQQFEN